MDRKHYKHGNHVIVHLSRDINKEFLIKSGRGEFSPPKAVSHSVDVAHEMPSFWNYVRG